MKKENKNSLKRYSNVLDMGLFTFRSICFLAIFTLFANANFQLELNKPFDMKGFLKESMQKGTFYINIDEKKLLFNIVKLEKHKFGMYTIVAEGSAMTSRSILTFANNRIVGFISTVNKEYKVFTAINGSMKVLDKSTMIMGKFNDIVPTPPIEIKNDSKRPPMQRKASSSKASPFIDLMVIYTKDFEDEYGEDTNITIQNIVEIANESLKNSDIDMMYFLVHTELNKSTKFDESVDNDDALDAFTDDGEIDNLRDEKKADMVSLFRDFKASGGCGIAWMMNDDFEGNEEDFEDYAFSVVEVGESGDYYCDNISFAHEGGHNLGCTHDSDHGGGDGLYSYSNGYDFDSSDDDKDFATIMSYDSPTIYYFSNPDITYEGTAIGVKSGEDDEADCSSTIRHSAIAISQFRERIGCPDGYQEQQGDSRYCIVNSKVEFVPFANDDCDTRAMQGKKSCDDASLESQEFIRISDEICTVQGVIDC